MKTNAIRRRNLRLARLLIETGEIILRAAGDVDLESYNLLRNVLKTSAKGSAHHAWNFNEIVSSRSDEIFLAAKALKVQ